MVTICLFVSVLCFAAFNSINAETETMNYSKVFSEPSQKGLSHTFYDQVNDLSSVGFDNNICSVQQTGMWLYYSDKDFNKQNKTDSKVFWAHGVDVQVDFPKEICEKTSSLRPVGNKEELNEDGFTLFNGRNFTGDVFYGTREVYFDFGKLTYSSKSLIITGRSPWTFFASISPLIHYAFCMYPTKEPDVGTEYRMLNVGLYPTFMDLPDLCKEDFFESARKGCHSIFVYYPTDSMATKNFGHH